MQFVRIVLLCIVAAIVYGIVHDQITAHLCVEYFTIGHAPIFGGITDPLLLGFAWGVLATWWAGLFLGLLLAWAARSGSWPKVEAAALVRPVVKLLSVMMLGALVSGCLGWILASFDLVILLEPLASRVPREKHVAFLADLWAHSASYAIAFLGGAVVIYRVLQRRRREKTKNEHG